jgi:hypothetical protein
VLVMRTKISVCLLATLLGACTQRPENITPRFASAAGYRALNCQQLNEERMRVGLELQRNVDMQRSNANADAALVAGSLILWPALLGLAATTDRRDQIAGMMGERDAMELVAREKSCPPANLPQFEAPPAQSTT